MKVAFYTLGCKVNQYETQAMEQALRQWGHTVVEFDQAADAYVVNTCSVTAVSDQKSRQIVHRVQKQRPGALVAVCGCYAQTHVEDVRKLGVDVIAGTGDRTGFLDLLEQAAARRVHVEAVDKPFERRAFEVLPAGGMEDRTRAMLKIEDGCVNFCTYCIIPYARGRILSLSPADTERELKRLLEAGYREIVLTGIEISSWGRDLPGEQTLIDLLERLTGIEISSWGRDLPGEQTLIDLLERVCRDWAPTARIRLGSLEPRTITEDFCRRAAALPNLCPQFHLSLQSGCDATLKRMNRKYDTARYYQSVELLNRYFDRPAITTDLITGFPEETEEEFSQTLAFIRRCGFAQMHIFPFSIRPGTPAADMVQVEKAVKEDRSRRAAETAAELHRAYLDGCVGAVYPVLFEQPKQGGFSGHAPNYMEVLAEGQELHNVVKNVRITGTDGKVLLGRIEE